MRRISELRQACAMTRQALGAASSVHPSRVGAIENGRITPAAHSVELRRLAIALKWPIERAGELVDEVGS